MQGDVKLKEYGHVVVFSTCVPNSFDRTIVCGTYIDGDSIPDPSGKNKYADLLRGMARTSKEESNDN